MKDGASVKPPQTERLTTAVSVPLGPKSALGQDSGRQLVSAPCDSAWDGWTVGRPDSGGGA